MKEAVVIGVPDATIGEVPTAFVVPNRGYEAKPTLVKFSKMLLPVSDFISYLCMTEAFVNP